MTEKRFKLQYINVEHIPVNLYDNGIFIGSICLGEELIVWVLNFLNDENEQLKEAYMKLKDRHSDLHDMCCDIECEIGSLKSDVKFLEKENKQLKQELEKYKELNIPIDKIRERVVDCLERTIGVYYND